jgi:alpha-beta hydrolase superfamily lysophospholipase
MEGNSITRPAATRAGIEELRRTWQPDDEPWADLVIVHGVGEHSGRYERTGSIVAGEGIAVTSFDLVGFGASGGTRGDVESWTVYLDQIEDVIADVRRAGRPLALFGQSMGGLLALEYALSERPAPDALVLVAPALRGGALWQRILAPVAAALAPGVVLPNGLKGEQLSRDPNVGEEYFADPLVHPSSTTRLGNELFTAMNRVRGALHHLRVPTLVIHGGLDTVVPPMSTAPMAALPGVERRLLPALRHEPLNEPEGPQVAGEIAHWLRMTLTSR